MKDGLRPFEFSEDVIKKMITRSNIPVDFYNKEGQVLIHRKENASLAEIDRLQKFVSQGIFYDIKDEHKLLGIPEEEEKPPDGLTNTKLFEKKITKELSDNTRELFQEIKQKTLSSSSIKKTGALLGQIFDSFEKQGDVMAGLLNVLDHVSQGESFNIETAVKRATVAMALKTRGLQGRTKSREIGKLKDEINDLMLSAILCDVGKGSLNIDNNLHPISRSMMSRIQTYPLLSFQQVMNVDAIDAKVARNILLHRRTISDDTPNNNYPGTKWLMKKLVEIRQQVVNEIGKEFLVENIDILLRDIKNPLPYDEDVSILAIASDFAALTSKTPWRDAYSPVEAVRLMINQSFYSYSPRITREFLDYVSVSLCNNKFVLQAGDYVVMSVQGNSDNINFDIGFVESIDKFQSRPIVLRFASTQMEYYFGYKLMLAPLKHEYIKKEPRVARFSLEQDFSRRIIYIIDPEQDPAAYNMLSTFAPKIKVPEKKKKTK